MRPSMKSRFSLSVRGLPAATVTGLVLMFLVPITGQQPASRPTTDAYVPPQSTYQPARTPWGDPDIQGTWDYQSLLNIERPLSLAGKATFNSDEEMAEWAKTGARRNALTSDACGVGERRDEKCPEGVNEGVGDYNEFWNTRNFIRDLRTSLIIDPPDGRFPPLTPEAAQQQRAMTAEDRARGNNWHTWEDAHSLTRCIASQTPNGPMMYNSGTVLVQSPGWVVIFRERLDTRIIPLDSRAHIDPSVRQWNGNSVGRFEGNVLVVETTNFTDKQTGGSGSGTIVPFGIPFGNFHLTERFVPVSAYRIHYFATVDDPKIWTRPWTVMIPWELDPEYTVFEYACHEGNISIENALRGARLLEAAAAEKK